MTNQPLPTMDEILARLCRRQRLLSISNMALRGLLAGCCTAAMIAVIGAIARATWMHDGFWRVLMAVPALTLIGTIIGLFRPIDRLATARALDSAAGSEDRFASALDLASHHRQARVKLVEMDALRRVRDIPARSALPWRAPGSLRYLPAPAVMIALAFWLAPQPPAAARPAEPDVSPDEWARLHEDFHKDLLDLPKPQNDKQRELAEKLAKLEKLLKENPAKKEVLEQIARLRSELEKRRQQSPGRNLSMPRAAAAVRSSAALKAFASKMKQGDYRKSADELRKLAEKIRKNAQSMSAEDFEAAAKDLERMTAELDSHDELSKACKNCAGAAGAMDRDKLADALERFARTMDKNCENLEECDRLCKSCNALDELQRKLNKCKSCSDCKDGTCHKPGCSTCNTFVRRSNKKGGSKAGWGTADKWDKGQLAPHQEKRTPSLAAAKENGGASTTFKVISKDERGDSALEYKDVYAELVQKAEADLALESAPLSCREYLRKYFTAIKPTDDSAPPQK